MEGNSHPPTTPDIKLVGASGTVYNHSERFLEWVRLVTDRSNPRTFGNFTVAASFAYDHDLSTTRGYFAAANIGSKNYKKFKDLASNILEQKGVTFGFMMDILLAKVASSQSTAWWEIVMEMMGYREPKTQVQLNQQNNYNIYNGATDDELESIIGAAETDSIYPQALTDLLVEGTIPSGAEPEPLVELHSEELRTENSPQPSVQEP